MHWTKLLADKSFGPPSAAAVTARKTGECLHQWLAAAEHQEKAKAFSDSLLASLDTCFDPRLNARVQKETMWGNFHQLRCSQPSVCMWKTFLMETLSVDAYPIFFPSGLLLPVNHKPRHRITDLYDDITDKS